MTGNNQASNRLPGTRERAVRLGGPAARSTQESCENPQVSALVSALEQLPGHHDALDLVGALVDLGVVGRSDLRVAHMFDGDRLSSR